MRNKQIQSAALAVLLAGFVGADAGRAQNSPAGKQAARSSDKQTEKQKEAQERAEFAARLNQIAPDDWRTARSEVSLLAGLAPGKALTALRALWPGLTNPIVKQELANAFVNAEHPDTLGILMLAAEDTDEKVRSQTVYMICRALLLPLNTKAPEALERLRQNVTKPLADAQGERLREVAQQIDVADAKVLQPLSQSVGLLLRSSNARALAVKNGLLTVCEHRLTDANATPQIKAAILDMLQNFDLPNATLDKVILPAATQSQDDETQFRAYRLLAKAGYAPGYAPLLRALIAAVQKQSNATTSLAQCVGDYGRPEAIPTLIGLIAADNNSDTIYNVGYFGLGWLTGVMYGEHHDGNWWRLWWEHNHDSLPASIRNLPIPELPRSKAYQEPLPREVHNDPQRYKDYCLQELTRALQQAGGQETGPAGAAGAVAAINDPQVIPTLIGMIAADNTPASIYGIGYFALSPLTGVPYNSTHDGNWWRLWWEQHRLELNSTAGNLAIPDLPHTLAYRAPVPIAVHRDPAALRAYLLAGVKQELGSKNNSLMSVLSALEKLKDPAAIAPLIDLLPADHASNLFSFIVQNGLSPLTGVRYADTQDRVWWQQWLAGHHADVEKRIAAFVPQPDYLQFPYKPQGNQQHNPFVTAYGYAPRVQPKTQGVAQVKPEPEPDDIRDVPSRRIALGGDPNRAYRIVGLQAKQPVPPKGYKLLVVLPGGDGSDDFRWFIRRMKKNAVPNDMLVAQIIAPRWSDWQANNLVWPTRPNPFYGMKFPTEQLIEDVIADVRRQTHLAPDQIYALAWSSSGPAVYTAVASPRSSLRGAFIAMSVFRPAELPAPSALAGKRFFLYHSSHDFIPIQQAHEAEQFMRAHGAKTQFREYQGTHGWTGNTFEDIHAGLDWLTGGAKSTTENTGNTGREEGKDIRRVETAKHTK